MARGVDRGTHCGYDTRSAVEFTRYILLQVLRVVWQVGLYYVRYSTVCFTSASALSLNWRASHSARASISMVESSLYNVLVVECNNAMIYAVMPHNENVAIRPG